MITKRKSVKYKNTMVCKGSVKKENKKHEKLSLNL